MACSEPDEQADHDSRVLLAQVAVLVWAGEGLELARESKREEHASMDVRGRWGLLEQQPVTDEVRGGRNHTQRCSGT